MPVPLGGVQVSQPALLVGVQLHPAPALTVMLLLLPEAGAEALVDESV